MKTSLKTSLVASAVFALSVSNANAQTLPDDYAGQCVTQVIANIAIQQENAQIRIVIDPIPRIAQRYNITCLRRIINIPSGGLGLGLPNPWQLLNTAVCNVIGAN